ncbi:hypothetical protein AAGS61_18590 [Lysinibacillus sp. KU-BSD001]|uniref:hypothetical protein n=1 Tax=Lysinibacillus sp. KU-BSD001 TaxID=3141328 RepID=UPI0036ED6E4C
MGRILLLFVATIVLSIYSITAFWIGINDLTTIHSIKRLPLLFSPASFVYLFTFVLYASLFVYVWQAYQNRQTIFVTTRLQALLFVLACLLQITFFYIWHQDQYITAFILLMLQLLSLFGLHMTYPFHREYISLRIPIAMWLGWNLFFILIVISYLTIYYEWHGLGLSNALWVVILLTAGAATALHLRYHHFDRIIPSIFILGYVGIAVANGFTELFVSTAALFLCGVMVVAILFMEKKKKTAEGS